MWQEFFYGRRLLKSDIPESLLAYLDEAEVNKLPAFKLSNRNKHQCLRCGNELEESDFLVNYLGFIEHYCSYCLVMGKATVGDTYYHLPQTSKIDEVNFYWEGELSPSQQRASQMILEAVEKKKDILVHAVTGAGKTEMIFETVHKSLVNGKFVCVASPRVDVCLELYPRFQAAFDVAIALLHGKQRGDYYHSQLVICTTHQLLRFYQAFDLLIVDEVDAFPFRGNPMLEYGVTQALRPQGSMIYLTATPTKQLEYQVRTGAMEVSGISVRYHGYPLPVPQTIWLWQWHQKLMKGKLPRPLQIILEQQLEAGRRTLVFLPTINLMERTEKLLTKVFPNHHISSASSTDEERLSKVKNMREEVYDLFLSTTILERGVTFRDIDVIVIGSNHDVFNTASLIQIAGRVGRKAEFPKGAVFFIHDGWSLAMKQAVSQIKRMNAEGIKGRLLRDEM
ncbi:DEAD/DEAH box helicase [Vagococcus elongatus]|uniref:DNA/RNA helicase n=1 Tax=Vagococcus elongatus TaxID=180344 RepID=A0A430AZJ0_9ENTE|nr:DEAD/DEAH box helicase [Vagococcus elongatus]RSU13475.1 hypothetical protein CBF29_04275 [Vagococcus elongatus]